MKVCEFSTVKANVSLSILSLRLSCEWTAAVALRSQRLSLC